MKGRVVWAGALHSSPCTKQKTNKTMIELFIRCIDARFVHCNKAIKCGGQKTSRPHFKDLWESRLGKRCGRQNMCNFCITTYSHLDFACTLRMSWALGGAHSREPRSSVLSPNSISDIAAADLEEDDLDGEVTNVGAIGFVSCVGEAKLAGRGSTWSRQNLS